MDLQTAGENWKKMQKALYEQLGDMRYSTWFKDLKVYSCKNQVLILHTPTEFVTNYVNRQYRNTLLALTASFFDEEIMDLRIYQTSQVEQYARQLESARLNPGYTFDTFIVGAANQLAHAASLAVAESPGTDYNPLFIYGGAGLGKTHLITAIANYVLAVKPTTKIEFSTSEKFTNEVVEAIRQKRTRELRDRMRSVDMLFIDDVQFLSNRPATQEEFFNTFNELYSANKQIVITSDRPPNEIATLEERMRSRFKSGVVVDIGRPDVETRIAILRSKAKNDHIKIDDDALSYIAEKIDTNIRELEGGLTNASLLARVENNGLVTYDIAARSIKDVTPPPGEKHITPELIIESVARAYSIQPADILSQSRSREYSVPRQLAMYLTREMCAFSTTRTGEAFGRDHSTVMHACKKTEEALLSDAAFAAKVRDIKGSVTK